MRIGLSLFLLAVVATAAFYLGTQTQETPGPAESVGKSIDETATEVRKSLEKFADDLQESGRE